MGIHLTTVAVAILSILSDTWASPLSAPKHLSKPPFLILAGDSTTATQSSNGGGWGDGFLDTTLSNKASGHNSGHSGATTVSFRAGGDWVEVLMTVRQVQDDYQPFVTIQFGHNDQKPAANISLAQYIGNLENLVAEASAAGATPIIIPPLSRRNHDNSTGTPQIIQSLANKTAATITAAHRSGAAYIDLNRVSTKYLDAIGPENAYKYNLNTADYTHRNGPGSIVFRGIVADLTIQAFGDLPMSEYLQVNVDLTKNVNRGIFYWPLSS